MANRTDAILLLASSSFLALGLASWYERVNDKPFDFVSIFGKSGAHAAMAEPSIEKKPPASAPLLKGAQLTNVKTEPPASPSAADISQVAVETSSAVKIVEPDKSEPETPVTALVATAVVEPSAAKPVPVNASARSATTVQTRPAARTVTIVLSPRPEAQLEEITELVSPASTELSAADVIRIAEELSSVTEDLDASGLLATENEQQTQISDIATSSASVDLANTDNTSPLNDGDQITLNDSESTDSDPLLDRTGEVKSDDAVTTATYRVEAGDSLYRIALTHGTSVDALKQLNALESDKLYVGDELQLPRSGS